MAKTEVPINFAQGLNTKTDPWQVPIGQFEMLQNSVFQKGGLLQKRNGYGLQSAGPTASYLTTLNGNLTSIGSNINTYSQSLGEWITKGRVQPCSLSVLPLIRNNVNQVQADSVVANGLVLTAFIQTNTTTTAAVTQYLYTIADASTGQTMVPPSTIPVIAGGVISGTSRVYQVGGYFVIASQVVVSGTTYLQYCSIPINNPINVSTNAGNVSAAQKITTDIYVPLSTNLGWDGVSINSSSNNVLVVAYNTTTGAQGIHVASLTQAQIASNSTSSTKLSFSNAAYVGALVSLCVDLTTNPNIVYVSFWNNSTTNVYTCAVYLGFGSITQQFAPTISAPTVNLSNLASAAINGVMQLFYEVILFYGFNSSVQNNAVYYVPITSSGSVGTAYASVRGVGLASKAFVINNTIYYLATYQSTYQSTYFLINGTSSKSNSPVIVAKLAYENGGGYISLGLPNVSITNDIAQIPFLFKDNIQALNTQNNTQQLAVGGIYSQLGINLASFNVNSKNIATAEIANNLHINGGYLSHYDGYIPVEHNFFLFPDAVTLTYTSNSVVTPTGTASNGSTTMVLSSATGVSPGMFVSDTSNAGYIPANTSVVTVNGTTIILSNAVTHAISGDNLSIQGNIAAAPTGASSAGSGLYYYQVTYEWTDNQGLAYRSAPSIPVTYTTSGSGTTGSVAINVPTLRLTGKVNNPVKIVIYRWSFYTQVYNQVTSITAPVLNDTTIDYVTFIDNLADTNVIGNNILYTTGGVVPDCNANALNAVTLFDTRLWGIDSENPNLLWVSKQVIDKTPVEMSQGFTIYVAPNTGTVGTTGPMTALAPMDDKIIIFKANAIFYINGVGPNNLGSTQIGCSLGNYSQPIFITSVVGCTNPNSIVLTQDGLMFQSDKGIWLLGRNLQTSYIGAPVEAFNSYTVNSAQVIPQTNRVVFALNTNVSLMFDYYYNQWGTFVGPYPISSCIYNGLHTMLDKFNNILQETPGVYLDNANPVLMSFTTSWLNLASLQGYERLYDFYILAKYLSPHSLVCQVAYDYNPSIENQSIITPGNFSGNIPSSFGVPVPFGAPDTREQWRIHAKRQLCTAFQLTISEIFNPAYGTIPGAGFTMSGITLRAEIKKATRPIPGANASGMS